MTASFLWLLEQPFALPLLVFIAETCVVTLSTLRTIFITRGMKILAPMVGFFEICIWLFAVGQIMQNLSNPTCYLAFASGFTTGNLLGIIVEKKLGFGTLIVRIITPRDPQNLLEELRRANYGVTSLEGRGASGPVQVVFSVVPRKELHKVLSLVQRFDPRAFYSVDELQTAAAGIFPVARPRSKLSLAARAA